MPGPTPTNHLNLKDHTKLDGPELWELTFGILEGDVPEQMTDEVFTKMAEAINNVFVDPLQLAGKFPSPKTHAQGNNVTLREAAQALLDAQKSGQQRVGYRLDLWNALEATIEAEARS